MGVLVAWIMARSRIRSWLALAILLLTGLGYIVIDVGQLGGKLGALFQNLNDLIAALQILATRYADFTTTLFKHIE